MSKLQPIGTAVTHVVEGTKYTIHRVGRITFLVSREDVESDVQIGDHYRGFTAAMSAVVDDVNARTFIAQSIPSTPDAIRNVQYMAEAASTASARKFWTLRLNRMTLAA